MEARAPHVKGRHASMDATRQWVPHVKGRHTSKDATRQWAPRVNGRLRYGDTGATRQWTPSPVQATNAYPARARRPLTRSARASG